MAYFPGGAPTPCVCYLACATSAYYAYVPSYPFLLLCHQTLYPPTNQPTTSLLLPCADMMGATSVSHDIKSTATGFTFAYGFFAFCFIMPPKPFVAMGWTVQGICADWLGNEGLNFVSYHVRRAYATLIAHALVLVGYCVGLGYIFSKQLGGVCRSDDVGAAVLRLESTLLVGGAVWCAALMVSAAMIMVAISWRLQGWRRHPIVRALDTYPHGWLAAVRDVFCHVSVYCSRRDAEEQVHGGSASGTAARCAPTSMLLWWLVAANCCCPPPTTMMSFHPPPPYPPYPPPTPSTPSTPPATTPLDNTGSHG
jgi:hypothetical protein